MPFTQADFRKSQSKYRRSAKGKAAQARYRATEKGKRIQAQANARRLFVGQTYCGHAQTREQAEAINAYIEEKRSVFIKRFAHREKTESAAQGQVPLEATV